MKLTRSVVSWAFLVAVLANGAGAWLYERARAR